MLSADVHFFVSIRTGISSLLGSPDKSSAGYLSLAGGYWGATSGRFQGELVQYWYLWNLRVYSTVHRIPVGESLRTEYSYAVYE
jgi:hypothetical protein